MNRKHTPSSPASSLRTGRSGPAGRAGRAGRSGRAAGPGEAEAAAERRRVRLMIEITARAGAYRKGLLAAVARLSSEEATILADLERNGLQVPQLHDVLCGGHVLVDDPQLYDAWRTADGSRPRLSSHHRDIDKDRYPDIGMRGDVVREKLHGRTAQGTWVQLEKTPAAFGERKLPTVNDLRHLVDYVVYRMTRSNVGPWGLSRQTERRPMYLSPALAVPTSLTPPVARSLTRALRRIEADDDVTAVSRDLADRFPPPDRADLAGELGASLSGRAGRGLFGNSDVWLTQTPSRDAAEVLSRAAGPPPVETERWLREDRTDGSGRSDGSDGADRAEGTARAGEEQGPEGEAA